MSETIVYEAVITGNRAPYKWEVVRVEDGKRVTLAAKGDEATFEAACVAASEYAHEQEDERAHRSTKETVRLLEVELTDSAGVDLEAIPTQPTRSYPSLPPRWVHSKPGVAESD